MIDFPSFHCDKCRVLLSLKEIIQSPFGEAACAIDNKVSSFPGVLAL